MCRLTIAMDSSHALASTAQGEPPGSPDLRLRGPATGSRLVRGQRSSFYSDTCHFHLDRNDEETIKKLFGVHVGENCQSAID